MAQQKNSGFFDAYVDLSPLPDGVSGVDLAKSLADLPGLRFVIPQTISKRLKLLFDNRKNRDSACQKTYKLQNINDYEFRLRNGQPAWVHRVINIQGWPLHIPISRLDELLQQFGEIVDAPVWSTWPGTEIADGKVLVKLKCSRDRTIPTIIEHRLEPKGNPIKLRLSYRGQPIQCYVCMEFGHLAQKCPMNNRCKAPSEGPTYEEPLPPNVLSIPSSDASQTTDEPLKHQSNVNQCAEMNSTSDFWSNDSATTSLGQSPPERCSFEKHDESNLQLHSSTATKDHTYTKVVHSENHVVSCKPEPIFQSCDINDVIRENQINFRPPEIQKEHFGKRLSISPGRRSSTPVKGRTVRVQIRRISVGELRDRMCPVCYTVELRRLQSGQEATPAEYWLCCHGWPSDPELCNCDKSLEAVWNHQWLFCTCKEPSEYRCCHGTDPPCWACLAVDGTFHDAEIIEETKEGGQA